MATAAKANMALVNMKTGNQAHAYISNTYSFPFAI
jgi:hypothetical protein